ncbi:carboxymuconolactone decarboxylase family protein [Phenylobacterium montanum]|uniref:carboxymuconolactone decarboxylase family protein n=1 Tax=Phenylobacterium montanum TaxID=2823693 RepID=UPI0020134F8F|nr:carboxymuconolactone decarboxylase family protein [Caulobacter sp. S6]
MRPGLTPRDRSLAMMIALAALGQSNFLPVYLGRAIEHRLTQEEFGGAPAHVAFYAGWGAAIQAAITAKALFT